MNWLSYLVQVNIYLIIFYTFYTLILKNETFFNWNRTYLVASGALAFLIPLMQSEWVKSLFVTAEIAQVSQTIIINPMTIVQVNATPEQSFTIGDWLLLLYLSGICLFSGKFVWQLSQVSRSFEKGNQAQSFFKKIKVSNSLPSRETILKHEEVHAAQLHSADVIFFEIIGIVNWFNPIVYSYKKSVRYIHEFIADEVASTATSKIEYAITLVSNAFGIQNEQLANNFFNQSLLKKRIMMLNKPKSQKRWLIKYGLSVPLFAAMVVFSSATINEENLDILENHAADISTTLVEKSLPGNTDEKPVGGSAIKKEPSNDLINMISEVIVGKRDTNAVYSSSAIEVMPEYPGGMKKFLEWVAENYKLPTEASQAGISGRLMVQFVVEKDGSLTDINVVRDLGYGTGDAAKKLLPNSMKWKPGIKNGVPVRVQYTLPIAVNGGVNLAAATVTGYKSSGAIAASNVEVMPEYPGGMAEFYKWIGGQGSLYTPEAIKANVSGRLIIQFVVETDGKLTDVNVLRDLGYGTGEAAKKILEASKPWKPGIQNGKPVRVQYTLPLTLQMNKDKSKTDSSKITDILKFSPGREPLVLVNGKVYEKGVKSLKPQDIKSISVLKDKEAIEKYGEKARDGVIIITMKGTAPE